MTNEQALALLEKYRNGNCTDEEQMLVERWLFQIRDQQANLSVEELEAIGHDLWLKLPGAQQMVSKRLPGWVRLTSVAASIALIGGIAFFFMKRPAAIKTKSTIAKTIPVDALPGGNKAYLTLADGSRISLTEAANGKIASQAGVTVTKSADGQLVYTIIDAGNQADLRKINTISTPKGGQWQVRLPDGSRVWLNAESSLSYPITFAGAQQRRVELKGEAYFEVAKDKMHAFVVKTSGQELEVLGTHFNISSYQDEVSTKSTLLEGSVRIGHTVLEPGEQATTNAGRIRVSKVDTTMVVAWKNGLFRFDNTPLKDLMRQISRWYDIEVDYEGDFSDRKFYGEIERSYSLMEVLNVLKSSKVHFRMEAGKDKSGQKLLVVMP